MSTSRIVKTMLEYGVNEASIRRVVDANRRVDTALNDLRMSQGKTGVSSDQLTRNMDQLRQMTLQNAAASGVYSKNLQSQTASLTDAQRAAKRLNDELQRGANGSTGGGSTAGAAGDSLTGRGGRLSVFGRELRALPAVGIPGAGFSTDVVGKVINTIGNTGVSLTSLAGAAGILTPAIIAGAVATARFTKEIDQYKSRLEAALTAQRTLSEARANLTTQEAQEALATATRERDRLQADAAAAQQRAAQAFADAQANFTDAGARLLDSQTGVAQLREEYEDLQQQYQEQADLVTGYTNDLQANAYATQDAAEAERQLTEDRQRNAQIGLSASLQARQEARNLTGTGARTLLEDLKHEYNEIIRLGISTEESSRRLTELSHHMIQLESNTIPAIDAREREEAAIESLREATEAQAKAEEELAATKQDIIAAEAENVAKLAQIAADLNAKIAEAEHDRDAALAEAERDAGLAREEAVRENGEALEEAETEHQQRLKKIRDKFAVDFENAVGERDAYAAYKAQQARDEQVKDEEESYKKQRDDINKRLSDTNKDIDRKLQEQQRTVRKRYEDQLRVANLAAQRAVEIENARARAQLATLQASYNAQTTALANYATKVAAYTSYIQQLGASLAAGITKNPPKQYATGASGVGTKSTANYVPSGGYIGSAGGSFGGLAGGGIGFGGFYASGGRPPVGRRVIVGENGPEVAQFDSPVRIYSNTETKRMSGGGGFNLTIPINGNNLSRREVVSIAAGELNQTLKQAGWK